MNQTIADEHLWGINIQRVSTEVTHPSPGLFDQKYSRGNVPGVQSVLPKTIETSASYVSEIEGSRAITTYALRLHREICEVTSEICTFSDIVRETGPDH